MVALSYPGVYVMEVPSGVRTITGVGTSIALFMGRARRGPLDKPVRCLNLDDYDRTFSLQYGDSDLGRAVRLFFQNGGTECFVMRVASGAAQAKVTVLTEAKAQTLEFTARSPGPEGNDIRLRVDYNTPAPEATFNLEVFRWERVSGTTLKRDTEQYAALSMDPASPRYVVAALAASKLVEAKDLNAAPPAAGGFSQSGRALSAAGANAAGEYTTLQGQLGKIITAASNRFRISVNGNPFVVVDLSTLNIAAVATLAALNTALKGAIENADPAVQVAVSFEPGPAGQAGGSATGGRNGKTRHLRITSLKAGGDVKVEPAPDNDVARALMMGPGFGGIEQSAYAARRPAANGVVFDFGATSGTPTDLPNLTAFAALTQPTIKKLTVVTPGFATLDVDLTTAGNPMLVTLDPAKVPVATLAGADAKMFQDRNTIYPAGPTPLDPPTDGVREKFAIIASAVNATRAGNSNFPWTAEVWGSRLALVPAAGTDNATATVTPDAGALPVIGSVRHYSLGTSGAAGYQSGGGAGTPGTPPGVADYEAAFLVIDREVDVFNLMVLPRDADGGDTLARNLAGPASVFCARRRALLLMDPPGAWQSHDDAVDASKGVDTLRIGLVKDHAAIYYPNLKMLEGDRTVEVGPSGAVAGVMARIDATRGVWKAPAGTEADIRGVTGLARRFSDPENGVMNRKAVNTIRVFPAGIVVWGARTMDGDDAFGSENKYVPIRRTANFLLLSLQRGLQWVVFQPNDEPLWAQIRLNVGAFMHGLFRQGAFQGATPREAYFVRCDASTTTQADRNLGIVNILVGFAPLKPAEFVVLQLQQMAGQIEV